jgi:hypothetical protein
MGSTSEAIASARLGAAFSHQPIGEDLARLFLHGPAMPRGPHAQALLELFIEFADRQTRHGPQLIQ